MTDHVRQGISVPVSILHQRQSVSMQAGATATFCSLVYATGPKHPVWSRSVGAPVMKLAAIPMAGRPVVVAGLADGRLLALPAK